MNKNILIGVIALVVLIGGYLLIGQGNKTTVQPTTIATATPTSTTGTTASPSAVPTNTIVANVTVTNDGFSPKTLTVKTGTKVVWTNKSDGTVNVSSDNHPTHLLYPFLNLGSFAVGSSVEVVVEKAGTYTYHNHLNPSQKGTIIAE